MPTKHYQSLSEYLDDMPAQTREKLELIRALIQEVVPESIETISYNMPAAKRTKVFVYYGGYKRHIAVYPVPTTAEWQQRFQGYVTSGKGSIQFPLDKELPLDLIRSIVLHLSQRTL